MDSVCTTFDLTKRFGGKTAVDHVSMTIRPGDIYGFVGKNGAGKTTLMRMILSQAVPSGGSYTLFGAAPDPKARRRVGALVEAPALYKNCSARENLRRFSILYGADEREIDGILEAIGLADTGKKKAGRFSLGMKQRLGIGIALLGHPEFIVLDEPVNGLDPAGIRDMRDLIRKLNREEGVTFLISSHLLDELARLATRYGMIRDGQLVEEVTADEIASQGGQLLRFVVEQPEQALAALKAAMPELDAELQGHALQIRDRREMAPAVNRILVNADVDVLGISREAVGMEEYIIERIGH